LMLVNGFLPPSGTPAPHDAEQRSKPAAKQPPA